MSQIEEGPMDLLEAMEGRRSIRAFREEPVPREVIEELLRYASRAPSALNLQPWEVVVVSGRRKEELSRRLLEAYRRRKIGCGPGMAVPLPIRFSRRISKMVDKMGPSVKAMGHSLDDFVNEGSCNFYGAPVALLLLMDEVFPKGRLVDLGIFLGYLLLAAHALGLGACPIGLITSYEDVIREALATEGKRVIVGVALGYPDPESPINLVRTDREELEEFATFLGA